MRLPASFRYAAWIRGSTSRHEPSQVRPGNISRGSSGTGLARAPSPGSALDVDPSTLHLAVVCADPQPAWIGRRLPGVNVELEVMKWTADDLSVFRIAIVAERSTFDKRFDSTVRERRSLVSTAV